MTDKKINVAIIGLGFGAEFIPIYQRHPQAELYAICQRNPKKLDQIGDAFKIERRYTDYRRTAQRPRRSTPSTSTRRFPTTRWMSIAALEAGKHVACTVPMATTVEDCRRIVELSRATGLKYMMMETIVYSREFLFVQEMYDRAIWAAAVPAGLASAGNGRLARLLGRAAADALRDALRRPGAGAARAARRSTCRASARAESTKR